MFSPSFEENSVIKQCFVLTVRVFATALCFLGVVLAQDVVPRFTTTPDSGYRLITDEDIHVMRRDIRYHQKQLIAANIKLTDTEAERFWPIYDQYLSELSQIDDTKYALVKQYLQNDGIFDDKEAESTAERWVEVDQSAAQLRKKYLPSFRKVLSSKKAALFCQLDRRVQLTIDMVLASSLPLIEP